MPQFSVWEFKLWQTVSQFFVRAKSARERSFVCAAGTRTWVVAPLPDITYGDTVPGKVYLVVSGASSSGVLLDGDTRYNGNVFTAATEDSISSAGVTLREIEFEEGDAIVATLASGLRVKDTALAVDYSQQGIVTITVSEVVDGAYTSTGLVSATKFAPIFSVVEKDTALYAGRTSGLPAGMTLGTETGAFSGAPNTLGSYRVFVQAVDAGIPYERSYDIDVTENETVRSLPNLDKWNAFMGVVEARFAQTFRQSRPSDIGKPAVLPDGLSFDAEEATLANDADACRPVISALQPWMVPLRAFVADSFVTEKTL
jgi:hypothetical protein